MKKTLIIIVAVGILGFLGLHSEAKTANGNGGAMSSGSTSPSPITTTQASNSSSPVKYRDGNFTGPTADTPYGPVQISAVISGGKISDINFLQMPSDMGHSREVTRFSEPLLKQSALAAQSANIDFVSGATQTSEGFERSLQAALDQAAI